MSQELNTQQAVNDLAVIRRAIENANREESTNTSVLLNSLKANKIILFFILFFTIPFIYAEFESGHVRTDLILESTNNQALMSEGFLNVASLLFLFAAISYFVTFIAAKASKRDFDYYIAKNFAYMKNLSFLSDLFIKFAVFSLLILAEKPEWIAPVLLLFTGDYIIQGRVFKMPIIVASLLGLACITGGVSMYIVDSPLIIWPLVAIAISAIVSLFFIYTNEYEVKHSVTGDDYEA